MINGFVPVMLGDKIIGKMTLNFETGEYSGTFDKEFVDIVGDGLDNQLLQVVLVGRPAHPFKDAQEKLQAYLTREEPSEMVDHGGFEDH